MHGRPLTRTRAFELFNSTPRPSLWTEKVTFFDPVKRLVKIKPRTNLPPLSGVSEIGEAANQPDFSRDRNIINTLWAFKNATWQLHAI
jgi:hypothetical protein